MRLYYGGYGHHPSGKQYAYFGGDNFRTGQNVVAPVTNKRTGKTYNTMFTIMRTSGADSEMAGEEAQRLSQGGIGLKSIQGTNVLELPGGSSFNSKAEWKRSSDQAYSDEIASRLMLRGSSVDNTAAQQRLLGG